MQRLVRLAAALALSGLLLAPAARGAPITYNGAPLEIGETPVYENTTFVSLRSMVEAVSPGAQVSWAVDRARVNNGWFDLSAKPGDSAIVCTGRRQELSQPVRLENGRTLMPIRPLAALLGLEVKWNALTGVVELTSAGTDASSPQLADDDVYWLSRIISAESQGECWEGKIAVGNVVLNRVASPDFPDSIYGVIFDMRWGGQFAPVRNGTIYNEPTEESVRAARAVLQGANTVGDSLYFIAPNLTGNHWTMENRDYITTIGAHWFYK